MTSIQGLGISPFFQGLQKAMAPRFGGDILPFELPEDEDDNDGFAYGDGFVPGASPIARQAYEDGLQLLEQGELTSAAKALAICLDMGYDHVFSPVKIYNTLGVVHARRLQELKKSGGGEGERTKAFTDAVDAFNTAVRLDAKRVREMTGKIIGLDGARAEVKPDPAPKINSAVVLAEAGYPDQAVANLLAIEPQTLPEDPGFQAFFRHNLGLLMFEMAQQKKFELAAKLKEAGARTIPDEPGYHYFLSE